MKRMSILRGICATFVTAAIALPLSAAPAHSAELSALDKMHAALVKSINESVSEEPAAAPRSALKASARISGEPTCSTDDRKAAAGSVSVGCVRIERGKSGAGASVVPFAAGEVVTPSWCGGVVRGVRVRQCSTFLITYETFKVTNGVVTPTGKVQLEAVSHGYGSLNEPVAGHQVTLTPRPGGWGDAAGGRVSALASGTGVCRAEADNSFNPTPMVPGQRIVNNVLFESTATAAGAVGNCVTSHRISFTDKAGGALWATSLAMDPPLRCDNAVIGPNPRPGCVVPWYASPMNFSRSLAKDLAGHIERAQQSGLPGADFDRPLQRTTDPGIQKVNRSLACPTGKNPPDGTAAGNTCDEYPFATTYQGMSDPGPPAATRRSHDGCYFDGAYFLPRSTGPKGVSVCMIPVGDQNYQSGVISPFYRDQRLLDEDPFRVLVVP